MKERPREGPPDRRGEARRTALTRCASRARQVASRATSDVEVSRAVCLAAVEECGFQMAWVGTVTADGRVLPLAYAGIDAGYLPTVRITTSDEAEGSGPTGRAVRFGTRQSCADIGSDPRMDPWREHAIARGFRSSAAIPLRRQGRVVGAFTVYAAEPGAFDDETLAMLDDVGAVVSEAFDRLAGADTGTGTDSE